MLASWYSISPDRVRDADTPRRPYHSPCTSGSACADRTGMRFSCRVTTALRFGSDAADVLGFPPFRIIVHADDDRHCAIVIIVGRKLRFVVEHIVQIAVQRIAEAMRNFQRWQPLTALDGVQRLPADINLLCELRLRHVIALNAQLSDSVQDCQLFASLELHCRSRLNSPA